MVKDNLLGKYFTGKLSAVSIGTVQNDREIGLRHDPVPRND